jgi:hypothetical protein
MRIGVLELLNAAINTPWPQKGYAYVALKQNASIIPQAVSVWCRDLGHEVFYATYYGQSDPKRLLPSDLDLVFISCHTQASPLAYALEWNWYLPNFRWGIKYYFDLLQLLPTGLMAVFAPLIAMAVKVVTDRIPVRRPRPARVSEE